MLSREQQALNDHLRDTLVQREVIDPMNKINWGHGSPPPPEAGTTPATEGAPGASATPAPAVGGGLPAATTEGTPPVADPSKANTPIDLLAEMESFRDANGLILGKYKDAKEAVRGVGHAVTMAKDAFNQRAAAIAEAEALRLENASLRTQSVAAPATTPVSQPQSAASQAAVDAANARVDAVLSNVVENGGVFDEDTAKAYREATREAARLEAIAAAEAALYQRDNAGNEERAKWTRVDEYMQGKYPDSLNFADEIGLHVQSDPLLQQAVSAMVAQGKEIQASELAWQSYVRVRDGQAFQNQLASATEKEVTLEAQEQVRREALAAARKDAGIMGGSAGGQGVHEAPAQALSSQEEINRALEAMRRVGDAPGTPEAARWRALTILPGLDLGPR